MQEMRRGFELRRPWPLLLAVAVIGVIDQVTKAVILNRLYPGEVIEVIHGFFNIVNYRNPGAAFGLFAEGGAGRVVFLVGVSVVAIIVIIFLLKNSKDRLMNLALYLIAGGAVGNLIDRVRFGNVVDFLDLYIMGRHWPAFNVADSAITIGVTIALISIYKSDISKRSSEGGS